MRRLIVTAAATALAVTAFAGSAAAQDTTLRVLVHQNPPFVAARAPTRSANWPPGLTIDRWRLTIDVRWLVSHPIVNEHSPINDARSTKFTP